MRLVSSFIVVLIACGDDAPRPPITLVDATVDTASVDAPDAAILTTSEQITAVRAATDGLVFLPIDNAIVTYFKQPIGNLANDPAGFTIQAEMAGPAIFIAVDPTLLTPMPVIGDTVSFIATSKLTVGNAPRVTRVSGFSRSGQGFAVSAFVQDISAATDLLTNQPGYDAELITVTGTLFGPVGTSGVGWAKLAVNTAGLSASDPNLQLRVPGPLIAQKDLEAGCQFTIASTPFHMFVTNSGVAQTQLSAFNPAELTVSNCPAPKVQRAIPRSATELRLTFSRNILASSVIANGSQFTFDNGLVATAATVTANTVTITTSAQISGTTYSVTIANTVTDLQGVAIDAAATSTTFVGFSAPAVVRINEIAAFITGGCDLIELRVIAAGSMDGMKLTERAGIVTDGELSFTFPALSVQKNDLIIVHGNSGSATCNPGSSASETLSPLQQPTLTFAANFDTAYDLYTTDLNLISTDNTLTLFAVTGGIVDGVLLSVAATGFSSLTSESAAAALAATTPPEWTVNPGLTVPAGGYLDNDFNAHAVLDLDDAGSVTVTGSSIQRLDDTDDNDKADWNTATVTVQPSTWGDRNAGQTAL